MQIKLSKPRALLFDWDNTLIDSWKLIGLSMNKTLVAFGKSPWSSEEIEAKTRLSMKDSFPSLFGTAWEEAAKYYTDTYASLHLDQLVPLIGAEELLQYLKGIGCYIGIVSNKRGHFLRAEAEKLGWMPYLDQLVGAGDTPQDKPSPVHAHAALAPSGSIDCSNVWFVGDTDVDLRCGLNIGAKRVLMRPDAPVLGEFQEIEPELYFASCLAIREYLLRLDV